MKKKIQHTKMFKAYLNIQIIEKIKNKKIKIF